MMPPALSLTLMCAAGARLLRGGGAVLQRWRGASQLPPLAQTELCAAGGLFGTYEWSRCHAARLAASSPSAAAEEASAGGAAAASARQAASSGAAGASGEAPRGGEVAEAPKGANADGPAGAAGAPETPEGAAAYSGIGGDNAYVELPGGSRVRLTTALNFVGGPSPGEDERMPVYRTLDASGREVAGADVAHALDQGLATKMYTTMAVLQVGAVHESRCMVKGADKKENICAQNQRTAPGPVARVGNNKYTPSVRRDRAWHLQCFRGRQATARHGPALCKHPEWPAHPTRHVAGALLPSAARRCGTWRLAVRNTAEILGGGLRD
eukprot:353822-Chlamydomonas_euryale.AAC.11